MSTTATPTEIVTPDRIMEIGMGFWATKTLHSAVELNLFTELAREPAALLDLQKRLGLHPRSARDFFDALVALGFLERRNGIYHNAPATDLYLDRAKPSYIGGILEMANNRLYRFWGGLTQGLRTGKPQNEVASGERPFFEALYSDPALLKGFATAMTGGSHLANVAIAKKFPWSKHKTFVDAGAAQGDLAAQVALANPHLSGIGFDLPPIEPIFQEYMAKHGLGSRVNFISGDFFAQPIPKADVVMMGHILHDWNLEEKRTLIRKAYEALPQGGAFLVYEALIDDDRSTSVYGLLMSLNMLIETPGGFDFTGADCIGWMKEAGFRDAYVENLVGPQWMVVGTK